MIINSIDNITLNQHTYLDLLHEIEVLKALALIKLKKEDANVSKFVNSKLYLVLKTNIAKVDNRYEFYLKSIDDYKDAIRPEVFDILMKE